MPVYEYRCNSCEHQFELWQEVGAEAPTCPECNSDVKKIFHPVRTIFKGSGFYITDTRAEKGKTAEKGKATEKTETKTEAKSETSSSSESASTPKSDSGSNGAAKTEAKSV